MQRSTRKRNVTRVSSVIATGAVVVAVGISGLASAGSAVASTVGNTVSVYESDPSTSTWLASQPSVAFTAAGGDTNPTIVVNPAKTYQTISGFGASITDTTAYNLYQLTPTVRTSLMQSLFSPTSGIGMSYLRQPIGVEDNDLTSASTFSSLDDTAADASTTTLPNFSIASDQAQVIPLILQAKSLNSSLGVLASSWSAPAWMKTNSSLLGTNASGVTGSLQTSDYSLYATYLAKFVQAYAAQGIPIDAITTQNEPGYAPTNYPGMLMTASQQDTFIGSDLGPTFAADGISTKILDLDHNWNMESYPDTILADPTAAQYVAGTAFHHYGGTVDEQSSVKRAFPTKDIYFTEGSNNSSTTFKYMMQTQMIDTVRNWAKTVILWNIAGNSSNGPGYCSPCQPMVSVNASTNSWTPNLDYHAMAQESKFVKPGAVRIGSNELGSSSVDDVAFTNPDGSTALVTFNAASSAQTFRVQEGSDAFDYTLPAGAAATFTWSGTASTRTIDPYTTIPASTYSSATSGVDVQPVSDGSNGEYVGWTTSGANVEYPNVDFQSGATSVNLRAANGSSATSVSLHLDSPTGTTVGTVSISNTGGWQTYSTFTGSVTGATGVHDLYVVFGGAANLDWLQFSGGNAIGGQTYYDDFEDGTTTGWTPTGGTWSNCQTPGNSHEYCKTSADTGLSLAGSTSWRNYSVSSAVIPSASNGTGVALLGRASDSSHFYQLELKRDTSGNESWDLYKNVGGTFTYLTGGAYAFTGGNYYYLQLVMNGSSLSAYVGSAWNGPWTLLGSATDTSLTSGGIGLRTDSTSSRFDLVRVVQG